MDKDEYKAYRETMIRRQQQEQERKQAKDTGIYDPRKMNVGRMPLGCWVLLGAIVFLILGLSGVINIFK